MYAETTEGFIKYVDRLLIELCKAARKEKLSPIQAQMMSHVVGVIARARPSFMLVVKNRVKILGSTKKATITKRLSGYRIAQKFTRALQADDKKKEIIRLLKIALPFLERIFEIPHKWIRLLILLIEVVEQIQEL